MVTRFTNAEQLVWQQRGHAALGKVLKLARDHDLPAILWRINTIGNLWGQCSATEPADRLAEFEAWAQAFDGSITDVPHLGGRRLSARFPDIAPNVRIGVGADIYEDEED